ncbi:phage portal protein [Roseibium alexandrii]|uniref:phage portal protein n=2 Tax=Roseibium alexandrii TaxID=388408 RepID=UPI0037505431
MNWWPFGKSAKLPASPTDPQASYFAGRHSLLASWNPKMREHSEDIHAAWDKSAARSIESLQNSGFISGILEVASGSTVGAGLRMAARPDTKALGWSAEQGIKWGQEVEARFRAWSMNPYECDAGGQMTFLQMQQAAFASYMAFGEIFGLLPMIKRRGSVSRTKVMLLPPSRLANENDATKNIWHGVQIDKWGLPIAYRVRKKDHNQLRLLETVTLQARDRDGRPNVFLLKDPGVAVARGISPLAPVLKVVRQVDQYADATLTSALIQTIFAATIKSNITGVSAFDGLMTDQDKGSLDPNQYAAAVKDWYDGASIDLEQHGRIAHLFPTDELEFVEAKQPGQQYDHFMGWLLREITRGAGVTYESGTGDYRGATYSSVRMASAVEWLTVHRRRSNLIEPFCRTVYEAWLEEEIGTGRISYPGGLNAFLREKLFAAKSTWTGPAKPQADDFKTARALQVKKEMQATTLAEISEEYGRDWDDDMRQRKAENDLADELELPRPWAPVDTIEMEEGLNAELSPDLGDDGVEDPGDRPNRKRKGNTKRNKGAGRTPGEPEPNSQEHQLELDLEAGLTDGD